MFLLIQFRHKSMFLHLSNMVTVNLKNYLAITDVSGSQEMFTIIFEFYM